MSSQPSEITQIQRIEEQLWKMRQLKGEDAKIIRKKLLNRCNVLEERFKNKFK